MMSRNVNFVTFCANQIVGPLSLSKNTKKNNGDWDDDRSTDCVCLEEEEEVQEAVLSQGLKRCFRSRSRSKRKIERKEFAHWLCSPTDF